MNIISFATLLLSTLNEFMVLKNRKILKEIIKLAFIIKLASFDIGRPMEVAVKVC